MTENAQNGTKVTGFTSSLHGWDTVRAPNSLFALRRLHRSRTYATLRSAVAVLAMGIVWILVTSRLRFGSIFTFLDRTITIRHLILSVLIFSVWSLSFIWKYGQSNEPRTRLFQEVRTIFIAAVLSASVLLLPQLLSSRYQVHIIVFAFLCVALIFLACLLLCATWFAFGHFGPRIASARRCLVIGSGPRALSMRENLAKVPEIYQIVGCIDDEYVGADREKDRYLGRLDILESLLRSNPIDTILIGLPIKSCYAAIQNAIRTAESVGVEAHYLTDLFHTSVAARHVGPDQHHSMTVLRVTRRDRRRHIKRFLDIVGALVLLVCTTPILLAACIAILITDPGPLLFVQERYGQHRKRFPMFKLRTMVVNAEALQAALESKNEVGGPVFKIKRDPRITRVGALLRKTSIDELPQLINVLRGDMSLVGPRPLPVRDVHRFEEAWLLRRFSVRPGLTCTWQVSGRSNTTFDFWVRQDLTYIDNWSLGLDFKILAKTVGTVLRGSGAM